MALCSVASATRNLKRLNTFLITPFYENYIANSRHHKANDPHTRYILQFQIMINMLYTTFLDPDVAKKVAGKMSKLGKEPCAQKTTVSTRTIYSIEGHEAGIEIFTDDARENGINRGKDYFWVTCNPDVPEQLLKKLGVPYIVKQENNQEML